MARLFLQHDVAVYSMISARVLPVRTTSRSECSTVDKRQSNLAIGGQGDARAGPQKLRTGAMMPISPGGAIANR